MHRACNGIRGPGSEGKGLDGLRSCHQVTIHLTYLPAPCSFSPSVEGPHRLSPPQANALPGQPSARNGLSPDNTLAEEVQGSR